MNQGHLQFTSQWRQQKGKNETKRGKKIKDRKKKGCRRGGKKINNPEKRIFFIAQNFKQKIVIFYMS